MLFFKLLVVLFSCYQVFGSESSEEVQALLSSPDGARFLKQAVKEAFNENKLDGINALVNSLQEEISNITLVGTQNVHDANGNLIEIRTIEIHLSKPSGKAMKLPSFDEEADEEDDVSISDIKSAFGLLSLFGFDLSIAGEEFDKNGDIVEQVYIDDEIAYEFSNGIQLLNKTVEAESMDFVKQRIAELCKKQAVSVHSYNENYEFVKEESHVVPEHIVRIISDEGTTNQQLLDNILEGFSTLYLENGRDDEIVPDKLAGFLKGKYPNTDFYVFSNEPDAWHLSDKDAFRVAAQFDLAAWESEQDIVYTIFGSKHL